MEFFEHVWSIIKTIQFRDIIDILAIALIIFGLFRLLRDTRAIQLLKGIAFLFIVYFLSSLLELVMLSTLLRAFFEAAVVVIVVIFQPEIRKALEQMGRNKTWTKRFVFLFKSLGKSDEWKDAVRKSITDAADTSVLFSRSKTGIRDGKLYAAGCILPLTDDKTVDMNLGTRHRAALGISEQSDSVVLVVSEETGVISLACNGTLTRDYTRETLVCKLSELLLDEFEDENPKKNRKFMRGRKKD